MKLADIFKSDLRGRAYLEARGLSPRSVAAAQHTCPTCQQNEMLPAVQRILANWKHAERRAA